MSRNSNTVYSTAKGRICPDCGRPVDRCICQNRSKKSARYEGAVRIRRETKGRKGKTVTTIEGVPTNIFSVDELARELKQACGTGGSVKDGIIVIQGDHRQKLLNILSQKGLDAKLAGG